ncbi:MAG: MarR family transcriptional regulator [Lachnospiraceae bacterium]|nr:MarR family transcriptional regulator [Lachnospiraceae bacterium]MDD6858543.1 MarR family transcriptional regulator [Lachnospiraceae bacterium]
MHTHIGCQVKTLNNMITKKIIAYSSESELDEVTVMHGWILGYLYDNRDEEIFQKDIEKEFEINKSTVTCIIKLMEKKGYIQRQSVEYDGRLKRIRLTDKGEKSHIEALKSIKKVEGILRKNIPDEELDSFFNTINKLKSNLSKEMVNNA